MTDDEERTLLKAQALAWRKLHDGGRLGTWWPAGGGPDDGESRPIISILWDHGGTGELGTFYENDDADKMELICDLFNWALEQLAPSEQGYYGERTYTEEA